MPLRLDIRIAIVVAVLTSPAAAQEIHADLCQYGCPSGSPATNDIVIRDIYILSSNDTAKFADWVAYRITRRTIGATAARVWKPDPWLADNETLEPEDYRDAHAALKTDRGHQAPLASFTSTPNWEATNYLSNITPQKSTLNRGAWAKLESAVRSMARSPDTDAVYVMTGSLYEREMPPLPKAVAVLRSATGGRPGNSEVDGSEPPVLPPGSAQRGRLISVAWQNRGRWALGTATWNGFSIRSPRSFEGREPNGL